MIARLYSNENFPLPVVIALRGFGHDVLTSHDAGKANEAIPDDEVLRFAIREHRAVITHNRQDFIRLHLRNPDHCGIIVCTGNPDFPALASKIHARLQDMDSIQGELLRINRGS
jgi:predicted nuclease of predicted toxin-antitoxin system